MSSQRHRAPCQLGPRAPAGTRAACGEEKRPLLGSAQGSEPAASHIKTPREPPQLPAGGLGVGGSWDTGGPIPSLTEHPALPPRRKIRLEKKEKDPTTDGPGEGSRAEERASQRPGTKSQTLNQ